MKKYVFKPYNKNFPDLFEKEKNKLFKALKGQIQIEHVGSTAVPGLGGKGIIDIAIAVPRAEMDFIKEILEGCGYEFRLSGSSSERFFLRADFPDQEEGIRRYHIHLTFPENKEWQDILAFRDRLRAHPAEAKEYGDLKRRAAEAAAGDGAKYRELKDPMFKKILSSNKEYEMQISTDHLSEEELVLQVEAAHKVVQVGSVYAHYRNSESRYRVTGLVIIEATQAVGVMYQKEVGSARLQSLIWIRPLASWTETVEVNGSKVARFQKI